MNEIDDLVLSRTHLVVRAANALHGSVRLWIEWSDLYQSGVVGLIRAAKKFNPDRGVPFDGYAYRRIRQAIIDSIRKALGRSPGDREFRSKMMPIQEGYLEEETDLGDLPEESLYRHQLFTIIQAEVKHLTPREELVISECFFNEATQKSVAVSEKVSATTVSNVRAAVLQRFTIAEIGLIEGAGANGPRSARYAFRWRVAGHPGTAK